MPSAKEIQKACKNKSTSKGYAGAIAQFMLWWDANKEDYEDDDDDAIFTQGATDVHMTNPDTWVTLMEWHADTEEDDAPKNPLLNIALHEAGGVLGKEPA